MLRRTLLLDMDGPLAGFDEYAWDYWSSQGVHFDIGSLDAQRHRYLTDHIPNLEERAWARDSISKAGWFSMLPVMEGAIDGVTRLESLFDVWVCTKPLETNPTCRDDKGAWIEEHFPHLLHKLIIAPDKSMVCGDILLDDAPAPDWVADASWRPVIFARPYNGPGTIWAEFPRWSWSDSVSGLWNL